MNQRIAETMEMEVGGVLHCEHQYYGQVRLIRLTESHLQMVIACTSEQVIDTTAERMNALHGNYLF